MAKKAARKNKVERWETTPRQLMIMFFLFLIGHSVVVYVGSLFFPNFIVLGNAQISSSVALLYSMAVFTTITVGIVPIVEAVFKTVGRQITSMQWMAIYFVINFAGLWLVARAADTLGLGLASWVVVAVLSLAMVLVQGFIATGPVERAR